MKKFIPYGIIISIVFLFFWKTIFLGKIPFPGDLLLSAYGPWRHVSYLGYVAGAVPSKDQYFDVIRELYPWKTEVLRQIKEGSVPLWNPYNFSGNPLLANYQSQVFYPLGILYILLPQVSAWTALIILQPMLGGIFMYLFATAIGISPAGAIIAAIAFNFSSFANVWMEFNTVWHTILWLPLLLYIIEKAIRERRFSLGSSCLFVFALFSSITGGHPQDFIYTFLFFSIYIITRICTEKTFKTKDKLLFSMHYALLTIIPFLLAAPQLLPTIELFQHSARVTHNYREIIAIMLIQAWESGIIIVQDFFGNPAVKTDFLGSTYVGKALSIGSAGFFLALVSLWSKKYSWQQKFFFFSALLLLAITIQSPISEFLYRYPLPLVSTGSPTRILFLFCFSLAMLAGFGYDTVVQSKKILWKPIIIMCSLLVVLWVFAFLHPRIDGLSYTQGAYTTMKKAMIVASLIIGASITIMILGKFKRILYYGFVLIVGVELLYSFTRFNPFVPKEFVFPQNPLLTYFQNLGGIDRVWGYGTAQIEANFSTQYRFFSPDGTDPLNLRWYNEFIHASDKGNINKTFTRITRSDAQIAPGYGERNLPENEARLRVLDSLGVKYVVDRTENPKDDTTFSPDRFGKVWHQEDWTVYENKKAAPRYFLTHSYLPYRTPQEFEQIFFSPSFDPASTILLEAGDASSIPPLSKSTGTVQLISYKPNSVVFETDTPTPQFLFVSDTYDKGWRASLNGKDNLPIYKSNYAFRSIIVPEGRHRITFSYEPDSFLWGTRLAFAGAGLFILFIVWNLMHSAVYPRKHSKK